MLGEIYILIDATIHDSINRRCATLEVIQTKERKHVSKADKMQRASAQMCLFLRTCGGFTHGHGQTHPSPSCLSHTHKQKHTERKKPNKGNQSRMWAKLITSRSYYCGGWTNLHFSDPQFYFGLISIRQTWYITLLLLLSNKRVVANKDRLRPGQRVGGAWPPMDQYFRSRRPLSE